MATVRKAVKIVPADRPDGRIVVRLVDEDGLVRLGGENGPIHYESIASALEACARDGVEVQS